MFFPSFLNLSTLQRSILLKIEFQQLMSTLSMTWKHWLRSIWGTFPAFILEWLKKHQKLTHCFSHNHIRFIEADVFEWGPEKLEILKLSYNRIEVIQQDTFQELEFLKEIDLSNNFLSYLHPSAFKELTKLKRIYLHNNQVCAKHLPCAPYRRFKQTFSSIFYKLDGFEAISTLWYHLLYIIIPGTVIVA